MFGLSITNPHVRYWGARAIYQNQRVDLLADRQSGNNLEDADAFLLWLNERALPWLQNKVKEINLATNDPQKLILNDFKYELQASTNASYGYLYVGAIEHELVDCEPNINTATQKPEKVVAIGDQKIVVDDGMVPVGTMGKIKVNSIGPGKVVGYAVEPYLPDLKLACLRVDLSSPPDWWIRQRKEDDIRKAVKNGIIPRKKGTLPEWNEPSPTALKKFEKEWKPDTKAVVFWPNDFVADAA